MSLFGYARISTVEHDLALQLDVLDAAVVAGIFEDRGVGFHALAENIDTTTPTGRLVFHLWGALGQFERDLIREMTNAGLTAAAARARRLIASGLTVREAAARVKLGNSTLYAGLDPAPTACEGSCDPVKRNRCGRCPNPWREGSVCVGSSSRRMVRGVAECPS